MQIIDPPRFERTVVVFQPKWYGDERRQGRFSFRTIPVLGAVRDAGHRVVYIEESVDGVPNTTWIPWLRSSVLIVVWFGEMYPARQIEGARAFLEMARRDLEVPIVMGGGFLAVVDAQALDLGDTVDGVVVGPGEVVLPAILDRLRSGEDIRGLAGLATWRQGQFECAPAPKRQSLPGTWSDLLEEFNLRDYFAPEPTIFGNQHLAFQVLTGLGCAKRCPFCFDETSAYGVFAATDVVRTLIRIHRRYGIDQFLFGELDFLHQKKRALSIADGLLKEESRIVWFALASVSDVLKCSEEELSILKNSGCVRLELGTESGSDMHLRRLGKRHRRSEALETARRLRHAGIMVTHNILFGVPGETTSDRRQTLAMVGELRRIDPSCTFNFRIYQIIPQTTVGRDAMKSVTQFPKSLDEIGEYRGSLSADGRMLPWMSLHEESWIKQLVDFVLPLAYHAPEFDLPTTATKALRAMARLRCRFGIRRGIGFDIAAFEKCGGPKLMHSFVS